jgi:SulP family sulfate permease
LPKIHIKIHRLFSNQNPFKISLRIIFYEPLMFVLFHRWLNQFLIGMSYDDSGRPSLTPRQISVDVLSGLTVSLALVPEAVAFAFVAGVAPLVGLYAAFIVGVVTAVLGGRPGMISGATGALAVVMVALVAEHGVNYLFATVVLMGMLQLVAGFAVG